MSFSVRWYRGNVQFCRTQMTRLGHMGEEVLAGSSFPQRLPQAREVRCFSIVCVGDDEAPLTTGSLFVFKLLLLCPLVFEAFLQSECTPQTQMPQVFESSGTDVPPKCSGTDVPLKASKDIGELCENTGGKSPKSFQSQHYFWDILLNNTIVQSFLGQQGICLLGVPDMYQQ